MRIEVDGAEYAGFVAASATLRLDALSNTFGFEATSEDGEPLPFKGGEAVKVSVDGELVLTGFIELVNVEGESTNHRIDVQGRDRTGDLLDSGIGGLSDFTSQITLKSIIERVIAHLDPDTPARERIQVVDEVGPEPFNPAEDIEAPERGQNAFEFLEVLARKRRVLLTSNADGAVVIAAGSGKEVDAHLHHRIADDSNNVIRFSASYDTTGRFNAYQTLSQRNVTPGALLGLLGNDTIVDQGSKVVVRDREIRKGRQLILIGEATYSTAEGEKRSGWERDVRRTRGNQYAATVHGFRNQTGNLWALNELVSVVDEFADVEAVMLVNQVAFRMGPAEGRTTTLSLVNRDAYSRALEEPEERKEEELGDALFDFG